ncbi:hypothetical protein PHJA_000311700 [Phtheirospermum japonicum]|uniref:Uncharacterized protein n=1 Tax=Phtheirospermum japonicum TaxID=374723 RepID=A0A830BA87_9LAMI|nr:hypothetical protein PHJA_000311700 [Phtheirospermum japonicum]
MRRVHWVRRKRSQKCGSEGSRSIFIANAHIGLGGAQKSAKAGTSSLSPNKSPYPRSQTSREPEQFCNLELYSMGSDVLEADMIIHKASPFSTRTDDPSDQNGPPVVLESLTDLLEPFMFHFF